jgi:putative oxidoreductase
MALALIFFAHAALKLFVYTLPGTASFFSSHGLPGWTAYPVFVLELGGAILLAVGLRVQWVAGVLAAIMLGAIYVHAPNGWVFNAEGGGWEYPVFLFVALVAQVLLGPGAFSLSRRTEQTPQ